MACHIKKAVEKYSLVVAYKENVFKSIMRCNMATQRIGSSLKDTANFEQQTEAKMRQNPGIDTNEMVHDEKGVPDEEPPGEHDDQDQLFEDVTKVPAPDDDYTSTEDCIQKLSFQALPEINPQDYHTTAI
jgi:hypothetical protein